MIKMINGHFFTEKGYIDHLYINDLGIIVDELKGDYEIVDMKGAYMYPAFIDCHLHLLGYGQHLLKLSLEDIHKKEDILSYVKSFLHLETLFFESYKPIGITKHDLDKISKDTFIYLRHTDFHGLTVNSSVLEHVGIISETGILLENEATLVMQSIPKHSKDTLETFLEKAYETLLSFGVVSGHSDDLYYFNGFEETTDVFLEVSKRIPFFSHLLIHNKTLKDYKISNKRDQLNPYVSLGAVKMFYDGTTTSKTALMTTPYIDDTYGEYIQTREVFESLVRDARSVGLAVAVHVIGDKGLLEVSEVLKAYPVKKGLFDRVIHASYANKEAIHNLKEIDVFLDLQPQFVTTDFPETLKEFKIEPHLMFPFKTYHVQGLHYGLSSDAPVEIPNPLLGMYAAITRKNDYGTYQENERLTRLEALMGYTKHAWMLTHDQGGTLETGQLGNLVVFEEDILTCDIKRLKTLKVLKTYIKGMCVYKKT
jgi:predicted amidohydrolase YtcJ